MRLYYIAFLDSDGGVIIDCIIQAATWDHAQVESQSIGLVNYAGVYAEDITRQLVDNKAWRIPVGPLPHRYPEND
jgi:hypothetical protein